MDEAEELRSTIYVYYDGAVKQDVARPVILFAGNLDKKIACIEELQFGNCRETLPWGPCHDKNRLCSSSTKCHKCCIILTAIIPTTNMGYIHLCHNLYI